jgi:hypothetical protein
MSAALEPGDIGHLQRLGVFMGLLRQIPDPFCRQSPTISVVPAAPLRQLKRREAGVGRMKRARSSERILLNATL